MYDVSNTMQGTVTSYNSGTGAMVANITTVVGSGTYAAWTVNLFGAAGGGTSGTSGTSGSSGSSGSSAIIIVLVVLNFFKP